MIWATLGGVTVGLCVLAWFVITWWPGSKALRSDLIGHAARLAPFLAGGAYGTLAVLTVGGLIGWAADTALWITNWLGDAMLVWGVGGSSGAVSRGAGHVPLTQTGIAIVLVLTVAVIAALKKSRHGRDIKLGIWAGIGLGTSAGVAGFVAVPLAQAANWLGTAVYGGLA